MAIINQNAYQIANLAYQQATGDSKLVATDLTGLIAMGEKLTSLKLTDAFFGVITDAIARDVVPSREYNAVDDSGLLVASSEWGALVRKFYIEPPEATTAVRWNLQNGDTVSQDTVNKLTVHEDVFSGIDPWDIDYTIPNSQLFTAFKGPAEFGAFVNGIYVAVNNAAKMKQAAMQRMVTTNFIASLLSSTATGIHKINLLAEYNTATNESLTFSSAFRSGDFLKYATMRIASVIKYMRDPSSVFNVKQRVRFTPESDLRVQFLSAFGSAVNSYLQADTYHNELTALPLYREVNFWQGNNQTYSIEDVSTINVTTSKGDVVNETGIIGLITDYDAMGINFERQNVETHMNYKGKFTNFFLQYDVGYFNDTSENGVVFVMQET